MTALVTPSVLVWFLVKNDRKVEDPWKEFRSVLCSLEIVSYGKMLKLTRKETYYGVTWWVCKCTSLELYVTSEMVMGNDKIALIV